MRVERRDHRDARQRQAAATTADADALVAERRPGHGPAAVDRADHVVVGYEHVVEEHLVELGIPRRHLQRTHLDTLGVHVDGHHRDAIVLGNVGVGTHRGKAHPGHVGAARPHLLTVHEPTTVDTGGLGLHTGSVRAGVGLAEELTPDDLLVERRTHPAIDLVLGGVLDDGENVPRSDPIAGTGDPRIGELLLDHELFDRAGGTAVRLRPEWHHVAGLDETGALLVG